MNWAYLARSVEYIIQDYSMNAERVTISADSLIEEKTEVEVPGFVLFDGTKTVFIYQNEYNVIKWCLLSYQAGERGPN